MREAMIDQLVTEGWITSPHVEAAFRAVPRHLFMPPGTPLEPSYNRHAAQVVKKGADGSDLSSLRGPWLAGRRRWSHAASPCTPEIPGIPDAG